MIFVFVLIIILVTISAIILIKKYPAKKKIIIGISVIITILFIISIPIITYATYKTINKDVSNYSSSTIPWDEGFNTAWAGTYLSKPDADYVIGFKLGTDGTYAFRYGSNPNIATSYTGKYNRNFRNGISSSGLKYKITEIRVFRFNENEKFLCLAVDWDNPSGKHTEYYDLYLEYR
jgi:energy-coupling factor transporter transmembrane protein EcfT